MKNPIPTPIGMTAIGNAGQTSGNLTCLQIACERRERFSREGIALIPQNLLRNALNGT